ncbi:TPA: tyrosine-type recombinase/integrase [Pseudomonas aeruginosa]|uniref:tyrosine-type recombinase/integrase n=1 Tax=Pseudomonas aeruginosa TaxID=287 RepID=UPI0009A40DDA|nr:site-specific integrase [Pseudomonas aeruginosa]MBG6343467.1 integrase arm-type DNA-binding domain-containing protein [Pseudomonas aeruginosa]MBG7169815.1 integrase arm-type DNA-binding domain-containing protein [Pseudomonas aeruginosa]MBH8780011.1 integrase arm-type DNA-binding domain-containing protein [Pseudomonas aeruginosa]MBI8781498.1 integrase arm-type DNA-binding domain-containing protein [Pseudomonas aeruginosa]MBI8899103.1 integrase arm-type DNA-binding domain-containing protein [
MGKLNPKQVENLNKPGTYEDGEGLRLVVKESGRKSWLLRFQLSGRRREMGLGSYPQVSLKEARLEASSKRRQLIDGIDPLAARDAERAAQHEVLRAEAGKKLTFEALAKDYCETHGKDWSDKWRKGWLRKLELYAFARIGKLTTCQIDTEQVLNVLRPIWSVKTRTADEVRGQIEQILDAAKAHGLRQGDNPDRWRGHLDNLLNRTEKRKARKRQHFAAMHWADVPSLMTKLQQDLSPPSIALQLLILTGARSHMVRFARWEEFDLTANTWSLPDERMKTRVAFIIPLAEDVTALLKGIPRIGDSPYLFPGQGKSGVMHANAMRTLLHSIGHENITRHGFRSAFRDWAGEGTHYPREICEMALAHDERSQTEGAYSRTDFLEKRRNLMKDWASYLTKSPQNPQPA